MVCGFDREGLFFKNASTGGHALSTLLLEFSLKKVIIKHLSLPYVLRDGLGNCDQPFISFVKEVCDAMSYRFVCDHCGKKFELDTSEAKECPFCFWTSSVKREEALASEKKNLSTSSPKTSAAPERKPVSGNFSKNLAYLVRVLLFMVLLGALVFLGYQGYQRFAASSSGAKTFSIKPKKEVKESSEASKTSGIVALSMQEQGVLARVVTIPADRSPDPGEQAILGRAVSLQTGTTEKLPSAAWTLEQYQKLIVDQEAFYKMPFARSYKKKLEELFKAKYLGATEAFAQGDVLAARNLWVESLAFPLYSTDLKKHRAVALTMLRPFINDTLSKVSAMNQSVVDRGKRAKEETLSGEYQKLNALIAQKKWAEALAAIGRLVDDVNLFRKNTKAQEVPPPYPPAFGTIDLDLQRPLMDLMAPSPSSTADLQPLQQDLVEKREVLETFTEAYVKNAEAAYRSALDLIHEEKWQEAIEMLGTIQGPPALQQDAAEKAAILGKMIKSST